MTATILRLVVNNPGDSEIEEARRVCHRLTAVDRDPATRSGTKLVAPGCILGCEPCFRACAVNRIKLNWWMAELSSLLEAQP
ncbi:hypothetical protein [Sphingobium chungbukense]|uniref:Uncharacterized protein n=1 Tax=Sphingobium chungbukense TaxID=56193 RepID=A0A0M3AR06_9SPHN|nr:hypothetical protein [Sphingobium chungbukense]KKW92270.1 hypothetical protein YP76_10085 [Sphingobium chungbukense]